MWKSLFLSLGISTGVAVQALPKAVCFRFDDNQNVKNYSVMAETFRKNNAVFSFSLNPLRSEGKKWQEMFEGSQKANQAIRGERDGFEGELKECDEGELKWVSREFLDELPKWEGDQIFLDLLWQDAPFFLLKLRYNHDKLEEAVLNGQRIR